MKTKSTRILDANKLTSIRVVRGIPHPSIGNEGELALSQYNNEVKLYVKYKNAWHGVTVGKAFDKLKDSVESLSKEGGKAKQRMQLSTNRIVSDNDFTLDTSGDIILDADDGNITIRDGGANHFVFNCDNTAFTIFDDTNALDFLRFTVAANGASTISTNDVDGALGSLILQSNGDLKLDPTTGKTIISGADKLYFDGGTETYIHEEFNSGGGDILSFYSGGDKMLSLDEANDKIIMGATNWVAGTVSGATITEFSAANSAYAGMILGYTCIGLDEAAATYNLTTSYAVPTDEFSVSFKAPPSGNVEIEIQIGMDVGSANLGDLYAGLSSANATSGYSQLEDFHESELFDGMSRGALRIIRHSWTLTGLTAGTAYEYWAGFKSSSTSGTPHLQWGGNSSGEYPDFIMKATALPATITT